MPKWKNIQENDVFFLLYKLDHCTNVTMIYLYFRIHIIMCVYIRICTYLLLHVLTSCQRLSQLVSLHSMRPNTLDRVQNCATLFLKEVQKHSTI